MKQTNCKKLFFFFIALALIGLGIILIDKNDQLSGIANAQVSATAVNLSANPALISSGQTSILSWSSSNATKIELWGPDLPAVSCADCGLEVTTNGSRIVTLTETSTYRIRATGPSGIDEKKITIIVTNSGCFASGCSGSVCVSEPVYTTCEYKPEYECYKKFGICETTNGNCGWRKTDELQQCRDLYKPVTSPQPSIPSATLSASPSVIKYGGSSTLSWTSENAISLSIDQEIGLVAVPSGSRTVSPSETTTYKITAENASKLINTQNVIVAVDKSSAVCQPNESEGTIKLNQNTGQYYLEKYDGSNLYIVSDKNADIDFSNYQNSRVKLNGCLDVNNLRVLSITKLNSSSSITVLAKSSQLANLTKLVATGASLWFNLLIALIISGIISYFIFKKRADY